MVLTQWHLRVMVLMTWWESAFGLSSAITLGMELIEVVEDD